MITIPCNCGPTKRYLNTRPDGSTATYTSEAAAQADVRRNGGSYSVVS